VLYFKFFIAPPSDVLSNGPARSLVQILDLSRHVEILQFYWREFIRFGAWGIPAFSIGIIPILLIFLLLFRTQGVKEYRSAYTAGITMLIIQALGYYAIYLITPYDLTWHLRYSIERISLQIFPLIAFLILAASQTPESVFDPIAANLKGTKHAARH
jgi:hypothetical protein